MSWKTEGYSTYARNPWGRGQKHCKAKLDTLKVLEIRKLYARGDSIAEIAREHGVSWSCIHAVVTKRTWSQVG